MAVKNQIEQGLVVKFNEGENLNGGTIVEIIDDSRVAINTLDGRNIVKNISDVIVCKYQRKGKVSNSFINKLKKEIKESSSIETEQKEKQEQQIDFIEDNKNVEKTENLIKEDKNIIDIDNRDNIIKLQNKTINALKNSLLLLQKENSLWLEEILNLITDDLLPNVK